MISTFSDIDKVIVCYAVDANKRSLSLEKSKKSRRKLSEDEQTHNCSGTQVLSFYLLPYIPALPLHCVNHLRETELATSTFRWPM